MMDCAKRRYPRWGRNRTGVTLVETMVTLAVLAVLLSVALPSFREILINRRLENKAREYVADINWARSLAVSSNQGVNLHISAGESASCYVIFHGPLDDCSCSTNGAACATPSNELLVIVLPHSEGVRIRPRTNSSTIRINSRLGTITPTMTAVFTADNGQVIHNVSNMLGRTYSCIPQGAGFGLKTCP